MAGMKLALAALLTVASLSAADSVNVFGKSWSVPDRSDWEITGSGSDQVLKLAKARGPLPGPRRPIQFALLDMPPAKDVTVDLDIRPLQRSCIIVFNYQDPAHFDYAHLSVDTGTKQPVHNGIFHVFGGERVRISSQAGPPAFPETNRWYHATLHFDSKTGLVQVSIDGKAVPALRAVDLSLSEGRIGLGSFDETGEYKKVKVKSSAS